jgi:hypothetical protein
MFVNLSPVTEHMSESLCSLRFAAKARQRSSLCRLTRNVQVNSCQIGTAKRNTKVAAQ